jgi:hypothetical protein
VPSVFTFDSRNGAALAVQDRGGLLVEERLVGRPAALGDEEEAVLVAGRRVQLQLRRRFVPVFFSSNVESGAICE